MTPTKQQLEQELRCNEVVDKQREISNKSYARKECEKAIIWFIAIVMGAVIIAILKGVKL